MNVAMLWFKFILGLMFFELVSVLFAIVPDYGNEYMTKENKNWTSFKNFAPKLNLNRNIHTVILLDYEIGQQAKLSWIFLLQKSFPWECKGATKLKNVTGWPIIIFSLSFHWNHHSLLSNQRSTTRHQK